MSMRVLFSICLALNVAACGAPISTDQAELRNIRPSNRIPKSSPAQFIKAFDQFCISGPRDRQRRETLLRDANYVPTKRWRAGEPQVFLVDDRRPAIVLSETICSARALSRTGQTERVRDFVKAEFPNARALRPAPFGKDVEQVWQVFTPAPAMIATERGLTIDGYTSFAVSIFMPRE